MNAESDQFEDWMSHGVEPMVTWSEPERYDPNDPSDRREMYNRVVSGGARVRRKVGEVADDLFEMTYPDQKGDQRARERFVESIAKDGDRYGKWHYFPWSHRLVQYPDAEEHRRLLTFRNRELITEDELHTISRATTAHIGLSVGSHIVAQVVHMGLGRKVILADPDVISVPNLNRIHAGVPEVGMRKTDVAGIRLSELNPYVEQIHLPEGVRPQDVTTFYMHRPDLVFEEVDHLPTKILMRKLAYRAGAALIMATDTGDLSMVDVERYDLGDISPFLGVLTTAELDEIEQRSPTAAQTVGLIERLIGRENISPRLALSLGRIGVTLGGIAQLGTTASAGAAYAAVAGRDILLGRGPVTGRYKLSPQATFGLRDPSV